MKTIMKSLFLSVLLLLILIVNGCAVNVPLKVDARQDMVRLMPPDKRKIPATVGIYIKDDLRNYQFKQPKMGFTFYMNVGEYITEIGKEMGGVMFDKSILIDRLPPYNFAEKPLVDAVVEPDIIYVYGNAIGNLSGYIDTSIKFRVKAYDLSGKEIWAGVGNGTNKSGQMDFVDTFLGHMDKVGEVGYRAGLHAAERIINNFYSAPPKELIYFYDADELPDHKINGRVSDPRKYQATWKRGNLFFEKKQYAQALYYLRVANDLAPEDIKTLYELGVCCAYCEQKEEAIKNLKTVTQLAPSSQESAKAEKWLKQIEEPLKIGVVNFSSQPDSGDFCDYATSCMIDALKNSNMYGLIVIDPHRNVQDTLKEADRKEALIVVSPSISKISELTGEKKEATDVATEYKVSMSIKIYSVKKKKLRDTIEIDESINYMKNNTDDEKKIIMEDLIKRGMNKLPYRLLEKDII